MTDTIGSKGAQLNLLVRQGATCGPFYVTLKDGSGAPIDITGATLRAQIRKTSDAVTAVADADFTITNAAAGEFNWQFPVAETELIACDPVSETAAASVYVWDMEILYADTTVQALMYGDVNVFREVTKP